MGCTVFWDMMGYMINNMIRLDVSEHGGFITPRNMMNHWMVGWVFPSFSDNQNSG